MGAMCNEERAEPRTPTGSPISTRVQKPRAPWSVRRACVQLAQIASDALLELRSAPFQLRSREVPIAIVHRLELAAVDRHARRREQIHLAAELDEARAHLADGTAVVLPEIGDRLMVGDEAAKQPHHLDVAPSLTFEPPARLHKVEIAVDVELQENRGMIGRPPGCRRLNPFEPEID